MDTIKEILRIDELDSYMTTNCKTYQLNKYLEMYKKQLGINSQKLTFEKIREYEKRVRYIKRKYERVDVYGVEFISIGETIPRLYMHMEKREKSDRIYSIVLPTFPSQYNGGIYNSRIFELFGKDIHFITKDNIGFWKYCFLFHPSLIATGHFNDTYFTEAKTFCNDKSMLSLSAELEEYAKKRMERMGIEKEYICLHARENVRKEQRFAAYPSTCVANASLHSFMPACDYLIDEGYQVVRMGQFEKAECTNRSIIDYANNFYDELMDFYLSMNCKFILGSAGGLTAIHGFWGTPALITNDIAFTYGYESVPYTKYDMYIPKKLYSIRKDRYLNLYESLIIMNKCDRYDENYIKAGIKVIDNTEQEILDAVVEMNAKIDGTWEVTEEEKEYMDRYNAIIQQYKEKNKHALSRKRAGAVGYTMAPMPIPYSYMKANPYLLEC